MIKLLLRSHRKNHISSRTSLHNLLHRCPLRILLLNVLILILRLLILLNLRHFHLIGLKLTLFINQLQPLIVINLIHARLLLSKNSITYFLSIVFSHSLAASQRLLRFFFIISNMGKQLAVLFRHCRSLIRS